MPDHGYLEFAHTADWGIHVWGEDLLSLLSVAAEGMYSLLEITVDLQVELRSKVEIPVNPSKEVVLVDFLNELLFLLERDGLSVTEFELNTEDGFLVGSLSGNKVLSQNKEIKAVTFHKLEIIETERGLEARVVFDV